MHDEQFVAANLVHRNQIFDRLVKCLKRLKMFQVSDVLAHECLSVHDQVNRVLQVGAYGQYRPFGRKDSHRVRCVPASTSKYGGPENSGASYRIIHSTRDRALADEEETGRTFPGMLLRAHEPLARKKTPRSGFAAVGAVRFARRAGTQ
jgi:hypothetical protein